MSTPAEKANLARIRDNQRRSRARRKEYLQELEQRLRLCELQGVEASAEIQLAARKVAEENKKLRSLLNRHGANDDGIEAYLQTGIAAPPADPNHPQYRSGATGNAVQTLEQLLAPRRPACLDPSVPFCAPPSSTHPTGIGGGGGRTSREGSLTSVSTSNTMWDTTMATAPTTQQSRTLPPSNAQINKMASAQGFMSPTQSNNSVNRTEAAIALSGLGSVMEPPPRGSNASVSPGTTPQDSQATQAYSFDVQMQQLHNPSSYSAARHHHKPPSSSPQNCGPGASSSLYTTATAGQQPQSSGNNCCMATDMISSMTGADPHSIRSSLGCVPGMECQVDNTAFNNAMERYTATTIGM